MSDPGAGRTAVPLRRIVVGSSLEEGNDEVVRASLELARAAGAEVDLIHALAPLPGFLGEEPVEPAALREEGLARHREALRRQVETAGMPEARVRRCEVLEGPPARILVQAARDGDADLIVVGAKVPGKAFRERLGSTADRVVRTAPCPVLVLRGGLRVPPARVVAAVDHSPLSTEAFRRALGILAQVAQGAPARVDVLHVHTFLKFVADRQAEPRLTEEEAERRSAAELEQLVERERAATPLALRAVARSGDPRTEILAALGRGVDLAVLGTHGRSGFDRFLMGSVAATVVRQARCSVLVVPPAAARELVRHENL
ncbi:MAG TPA: universal stress protein [Thermoanaerobaculia bacterium]|nr:universal stress protein [Thermoanaerobaculia bacterium]